MANASDGNCRVVVRHFPLECKIQMVFWGERSLVYRPRLGLPKSRIISLSGFRNWDRDFQNYFFILGNSTMSARTVVHSQQVSTLHVLTRILAIRIIRIILIGNSLWCGCNNLQNRSTLNRLLLSRYYPDSGILKS